MQLLLLSEHHTDRQTDRIVVLIYRYNLPIFIKDSLVPAYLLIFSRSLMHG